MAGMSASASVLCLLGMCTIASASNFECPKVLDDGTTDYDKCADGMSHADANTRALVHAFARSNVTDVVFLVDRSYGMNEGPFETIKNSITTLMDYLMRRRLVYLHPDYTRVSVVSFAVKSMVEFDGIGSEPVHACNFDEKLASINRGTPGKLFTNLASALSDAEQIFGSSPRHDAHRIMWVFTDGDTDCSRATGEMKGQGVTVFSAGVGDWMHMAAREDAVRSFADDPDHYACAKDWTLMMKDAMGDIRPHGENGTTLYVTDDTYTYGSCSGCQRCVCNVLDRRYTCARYGEMATQTTPEVGDPTNPSPHPLLEGNVLRVIIIASSATLFLLVLVVCCICCCRCWKKCRREKHPKPDRTTAESHDSDDYVNVVPPEIAPRVPPKSATTDRTTAESHDSDDYVNVEPPVAPPLTPRRTRGGHLTNDTNHYTGHIESSRPDVLPRQERGGHAQVEMETETNTHDVHDGSRRLDDGEGDQHSLDQPVGPYLEPETRAAPKASHNYDYAYDHLLMGPDELKQQVKQTATDHRLQGLLIYNCDKKRQWAGTRDFILPRADIKTVRILLRSGGTSLSVAKKTYTVDQDEISEMHVHATNEAGDHLWAAIEGSYVIIGVAGPHKSKACEDVVFNFMRHLNQSTTRENESTS